MANKKCKLTSKQQRFVNEYLIDLNATQAAIRAGYSKNTAKEIGCENLTKPNIQEYISKKMKDREKRTEITQDMVLKELADIAFDDIKNYLSFNTDEKNNIVVKIKDSEKIDTKNISEVSIGKDGQFKFKLYCKDAALVNVGKHLGMFVDKVESSNVNLNSDVTKLSPEERKKRIADLLKERDKYVTED